uniref:MULE transposase domain-containing protein n=1 Tax=Lactuca sativa TaxID=4236 RepID=A0A9R1VNT7_LACSA|nr:hypothetical protein LSAT_V11C400211240 [Lactuca sativa]
METVDDFDTIDVELDEFFKHKQRSRCKDEFLNTLIDEAIDECTIPEINLNDFEGIEGDDEDKLQFQYSTHDPKVKWNNMKPVLGERYESPHQLKLCLTNYSISRGYPIRFNKCDSVRLVAVCASDPEKFQCTFVFLKEMIRKPNMKCTEMQAIIQRRFHCKVSWSKCYRAKCRAISLIDGKLSDHYTKVWDYGHELMRSNPRSTIQISVTVNPDNTTTFHRICTCFKAIKEGWKVGCRRVIGLDGRQCKGELLTSIGRDANNHVYPIAWAVVEIENKPNWQWFLELLHDDLELQGGFGFGLLEAVKVVLLHVEHRQCARHVYPNFIKVFSGIEFKMFNAIILDARKKPLLAMLEEIRLHMMERLFNLKQEARKWVNNVCPGPIKKMDEFAFDIKSWYVHPSDFNAFEVRNGFHSYGVNLEGMYCTSRLSELSGIPCVHAQATIIFTQQDLARFISKWFGKDKFLAMYDSKILHVNDSNIWEPTPYTKPLPPIERRMPGRPCMKRKRHVSEHQDRFYQVSHKGRTVQCQNCMQMGHNKVSCKNPSVKPTPKPKKKIGRPRLNPELTNCTRLGRSGGRGGRRGGGRGVRRGGRSGGRGSTSVYEEGESSGKKEPGIETQFVTQTTPNVESQFVTQTAPTVDSEHVPKTQEADVKIDVEGDGLDMADLDQILHDLSYIRESKYSEAEILLCLNITQSQLKGFDALLHQSKQTAKDVPFVSEHVPETQEDNDENKEDSDYEDVVEESQVDNDEDGAEDDEEGVDDTQVRVRTQGRFRTRKLPERIIENMMKKIVADKKGIGMAPEKPLSLD